MRFASPEGWDDVGSWERAVDDLARLASQWGLDIVGQLPGATCSLVADVRRHGARAVLKITLAEEERVCGVPTAVAHAGHGGIPVWEHDEAAGALLMPFAVGPTLDRYDATDDEQLSVQAGVALRLQGSPGTAVWPMERWFELLGAQGPDRAPLDPGQVRRARAMFEELEATTTRRTLVHGDLHHFNIIRHDGEWVAIDPKGMWCDPAVEPAAYLRNIVHRLPTGDALVELTSRRLRLFADQLGEPWDRVWGWGFVVAVVSVLWASDGFLAPWTELVRALERLEP